MLSICQGQYGATILLMNGEPGKVIQPGDTPEVSSTESSAPAQLPEVDQPSPVEDRPESGFFNGEKEPGAYASTELSPTPSVSFFDGEAISWTASEFIDHQKSAGWFLILGIIAIAASVGLWFITGGEWFASLIVILFAVIFGIGAARRPRELEYAISADGVRIDQKLFPYSELRSFSVVQVGAIESILLLPAKRWQPTLSLYFDQNDAEKIVDTLGSFLPYEERTTGATDKFLYKIRF